jgi:hypothetical protein
MNISEIPAWESLATEPLDGVDERILNRIGRLYDALDPVPEDLVDRLQFAITLDALHVEIAKLQLASSGELAMRGAEQVNAVKTLTFSSESVTTMVTISSDGPDRVRIDGWAAPGGNASVEVTADSDGRFVFDDVAHGLTRFVIRAAEVAAHPPVATPAVEI